MPVFQRYNIERYKEILTTQPAGLVPDGGFSTYSLDDPNIVPNGTGDFLGVIKTVILLAEVYRETIDTRNISFAQFNNLTQQEFDNYIRQGLILRNGATNGQPERIGWVEIGRSYASFYYQSCSGGKNPISEHFYDIQEFAFDNKIVYGEGLEVLPSSGVSVAQNTPLTPIGNFDPNNATNLGIIRPRFNPLSLNEYIKFAMVGSITNSEGETYKVNNLALTDQTRPSRVSLLMANRGEHFDNQYATEISPGKWGVVRRTISESLKPGVHVIYPQLGFGSQQNSYDLDFSISEGQCLQTTVVSTTSGGGLVVGGVGDGTTTTETQVPTNIDDFLPLVIKADKRWNPVRITGISEDKKGENNSIVGLTGNTDDGLYTPDVQNRLLYQIRGTIDGWKDPREIFNDNLNIPLGYLYGSFNSKTDIYEISPAILRETTIPSIPQKIGSTRSSLANIYRRNAQRMYTLYGDYRSYKFPPINDKYNIGPYEYDRSRKNIFERDTLISGIGTDEFGRYKFTDSNSFRERCIFTGYNETFNNSFTITVPQMEAGTDDTKAFWRKISETSKSKRLNNRDEPNISPTFKDIDGVEKSRSFVITYLSKSQKYSLSSLPISTIFLGYNENYPIEADKSELDSIMNSSNQKDSKMEFLEKNVPEISSGGKDMASRDNSLRLYQSSVTIGGRIKIPGLSIDTPFNVSTTQGSFRNLLIKGVYKNDIVLENTDINTEKIYLKRKIKSPILARRSELYGPNPFKHILYADFVGWYRYMTDYNIKEMEKIISGGLKNKSCYDEYYRFGGRIVSLSERFHEPIFRKTDDRNSSYWIEIKDKTRIIDVYFGLMEMHIKGYPWHTIFEVMDRLPTVNEFLSVSENCSNAKSYMKNANTLFNQIATEFENVWDFMLNKKYVQMTPNNLELPIS